MTSMAAVLYEHWRSHSYELDRQPAFKDAAPNLRATFEKQEAALLAAGARIPRTITTLAELEELPNGSVIRDRMGDVSERRGGRWCAYETATMKSEWLRKYLPATVLKEVEK